MTPSTINPISNNTPAVISNVSPDASSPTTTTASNATATFSGSAQNVTLNATVTSSAGTVNKGSVQFTILKGTTIIGTAKSGTVNSSGQASVSYALPASEAAGTYTIEAVYSDSTGTFASSSDKTHTLTINQAATTTTASNATAAFSSSAQNVTLNATVTSSAGTVNEGKVTFSILQGTQLIGTATSKTVSNGSASVSYSLPAGTDAGTYTIEADYSDSGGNFANSSDTSHTLTVTSATAANTTTTASNATATFSNSAQNVTLNATVTSGAGTVNEGTVTFSILQGTTVIGTATKGTVNSSGQASVSYSLPAGTAPGTYTIEANYSDSTGKFAISSDTSHKLTVNALATTTTAADATATFSGSSQNVTLTATVTASGATVNEGTVSFTLQDSLGNTIGTATSGTVNSSGQASVSYALPAGTAAGVYTIVADYSDSAGKFTNSSDSTHSLTVNAASTTTAATNATVSFSSSTQNVTLSATVTSKAGTVNEGSVSFTLLDSNGNTVGTATSGAVSNGSASVSYALPAGQTAGTYTIVANYSDSTGNFANSADSTHTLTVGTATATSVTLTSVNITPNLSKMTASVTLTAQVSNGSGTVGEGIVTFTMAGVTAQGNVVNGVATVQLSVPLTAVTSNATVTLSYHDNAASPSFSDGRGAPLLSFNLWTALLPSNLTFAADGTELIQVQSSGQQLFGYAYSATGQLLQISLSSDILPVSYSNVGGQTLVSIDGLPWQLVMVSNGQYQGSATLAFTPDGSAEVLLFGPTGQIIGAQPT